MLIQVWFLWVLALCGHLKANGISLLLKDPTGFVPMHLCGLWPVVAPFKMATLCHWEFEQQIKWLRSDLDGRCGISLGSKQLSSGHSAMDCFQMERGRWMSSAGHPPLSCWPMYIIYSLIVARHAHIHNLHLLYFQIFHISRLRVIIHFSTTPVHRSFVVFVWIFNVWRWRVHGCSALNVVIRWLVIEGNCSIRLALICSAPAFERCSVQN